MQSKIQIKIKDIEFLTEGTESWVTEQYEKFLRDISDLPISAIPAVSKFANSEAANGEDNSDEDIYIVDDNNINVICDIPGNENAQRTFHLALLYAYASKKLGFEDAKVEDIRNACIEHGCYDATNFSTHIKKGTPQLYLDKGSGKERSIKLTKPGENKAKELIMKIRENGTSKG